MPDLITLTGFVATAPKAITTAEGLAITSFRLASNQRRFDRTSDKWVDGDTNWYTVTAFRQLATNAAMSVHQGDRVVVNGKIRLRDWESNGKRGVTVEVDADALGHDLTWGTAAFSRSSGSMTVTAASEAFAPTDGGAPEGSGWATAAVPTSLDSPSGDSDSGAEQDHQLVGATTAPGDIETPF